LLTKGTLLNFDVTLNEGNDPGVCPSVVEVDQLLDERLVEEEPVVDCAPCPGVKVTRIVLRICQENVKKFES
jgi:hypothetical protein